MHKELRKEKKEKAGVVVGVSIIRIKYSCSQIDHAVEVFLWEKEATENEMTGTS